MILVIIGVSVTGFFVSTISRNIYISETEKRLVSCAYLIKEQIMHHSAQGLSFDYKKSAIAYSDMLSVGSFNDQYHKNEISQRLRITFVDKEGNVLGDSDALAENMQNHSDRPEIIQALRGVIGKHIRKSRTVGYDMMYIAVPVEEKNMVVRLAVPLIFLKELDITVLKYTFLGMIFGIILTMLLALKFSTSIIKPLKVLIQLTDEIAQGNYNKRVDISRSDEIGILADNFNNMAQKLNKTISDLKDKNEKLDTIINSMTNGIIAVNAEMKIILVNSIASRMFRIESSGTDENSSDIRGLNIIEVIRNSHIINNLKDTLRSGEAKVFEINWYSHGEHILRIYINPIFSNNFNLHNTNLPTETENSYYKQFSEKFNSGAIISIHDITAIKKLEQMRSEFVSNVTHELKTPLTSIRGFVETLRNGAISNPDVADRFLEIIDIEAERLYNLINDILQLADIESRKKDTNIVCQNICSIVDEVVSLLSHLAEKKNVELILDIDKDMVLCVNKDRFKQMLINLIDNAIKYNKENGKVWITAYKEQGRAIIKIKDTGIGIPEHHHSRIFERFYRVDKGRSRNLGGTGLGLSIVKHIVNLYNGDIKIWSKPGIGTEFTIQLPV